MNDYIKLRVECIDYKSMAQDYNVSSVKVVVHKFSPYQIDSTAVKTPPTV